MPLGKWTQPTHQIWKYMLEKPNGRLLIYDSGRHWAHYMTENGSYTRRCQRLHAPHNGTLVEIKIIPSGYQVRHHHHVNIFNPPRVNEIAATLKQAKTSVKHCQCNDEGKFATLWKGGSDILIGTDGGLKDNIGTSEVILQMADDTTSNVTAMTAESCSMGTLHFTREELRGILPAEEIISRCGE